MQGAFEIEKKERKKLKDDAALIRNIWRSYNQQAVVSLSDTGREDRDCGLLERQERMEM